MITSIIFPISWEYPSSSVMLADRFPVVALMDCMPKDVGDRLAASHGVLVVLLGSLFRVPQEFSTSTRAALALSLADSESNAAAA